MLKRKNETSVELKICQAHKCINFAEKVKNAQSAFKGNLFCYLKVDFAVYCSNKFNLNFLSCNAYTQFNVDRFVNFHSKSHAVLKGAI